MSNDNLILNTDSYKASHHAQYPSDTTRVSSYIETRGNTLGTGINETVFFGLQYLLAKVLSKPVTFENLNEAQEVLPAHGLCFNRLGWEHIINKHGGYPPLKIQAVAEGSVLPTRIPQVQIVNTDPMVPWLTSYVETALLRAVWYPSTVATISFNAKIIIYKALLETSDDPDGQIPFKLHDFGARGASSYETSAIGGAAHLTNFMGTDTLSAIRLLRSYYGAEMAGFSIPAAEHSTITCWGGPDKEIDAFRNILAKFAKPGALVAVVSDSYDIYRAARELWGKELKQQIIDSGATVVVRPDSGDPVKVSTEVVSILAEKFGTTTNSKGYRVLNNVRVIQGDGINLDTIREILSVLKKNGFSADNMAFGMGGALLQKMDRDTLKYAMKASAIERNGVWYDVFKDPKTDNNKQSKKGRQAVIISAGLGNVGYHAVREDTLSQYPGSTNLLQTVFENGEILIETNLESVRSRTNEALKRMISR